MVRNRIDYIAVPKRLLDDVSYCRVAYSLAVQLQAAATTKCQDHAPLMIDLQHRDWRDPIPLLSTINWDRGQMKAALQEPETTQDFQSRLQSWADSRETQYAWEDSVENRD
eukprot:11366645-Heterocapsa_arctica.AAC.1